MADESADLPLERRNGYVSRGDFDRLRDEVSNLRRSSEEFHTALAGSPKLKGTGLLPQMRGDIIELQDGMRLLQDNVAKVPERVMDRMTTVIDARIEAAQKAAKGDRATALLGKWETFGVGVLILVVGSVLTTILVAHFTSHP